MKRTKLAIIGTTGLPAKYGGFETLAHHLVSHLKNDFAITVYCSSRYFARKASRRNFYNGARLKYVPLNANGYQSIPYDIFSLIHAVIFSEVLLVLGVSGAVLFPFLRLFTRKQIIVNIDGMEWSRPKWNGFTKKVLKISEWFAVRFAHTVIADNQGILDYVKKEYRKDDVRLIAYGGDHVTTEPITSTHVERYPFLLKPYAFKVCRIEPENNVEMILDTYALCPSQTLVVVGLWNHGEYGIRLRKKFSSYANIHLLDPIYNQQELNVLRSNASFYIHGHSAGGTNPSLVEAMALGLPILSFDVIYNRATTANKALYFNDSRSLAILIENTHDAEWEHIASNMKRIALQQYCWKNIADAYAECAGYQPTTHRIQLEDVLKGAPVQKEKVVLEKSTGN